MLFSLILQTPNVIVSSLQHSWPCFRLKVIQLWFEIQSCKEMDFGLQNAKSNIENYYSSYGLFAKSGRLLLMNLWPTCQTNLPNYSCGSDLFAYQSKLLFYLWCTCKTRQTITLFVGYLLVVLLCVLFAICYEAWNYKVSEQHVSYYL